MEKMTIGRAAGLCGGTLYGVRESDPAWNTEIGRIVIDTRAVQPGDLFAAFRGEKADGHHFIGAAFDQGASCCLGERVPEGETRPVIVVQDVLTAMEQIAAGYREQFDLPVVGITGSVGKTTAKEMISAVMERHFRTLKTEGNLNNRYGVPMMLSRLNSGHQAAVIEMGISEFGEMRRLARMVQPTMAVYTTIGHAHLEFLHDLDGVLKAKTEMLETMPETAPVVVNGDDEKLRSFFCRQRKITYGFGEHCDVRAENYISGEEEHCDVVCGMRRIPVCIPAAGKHYVYAALAAAAVGMLLGLDDREIADGISAFRNVERRGDTFLAGGIKVVDDSYNANPDSVCNAIDNLTQMPAKRHLCILGDMLELGENTLRMHEEVGAYAKAKGIDLVLTSGRCAREMSRGAEEKGLHFESKDALITALPGLLRAGDCVLVKASKGSHFEAVSAALRDIRPDGGDTDTPDIDEAVSTIADGDSTAAGAGRKPAPESAPCVLLDLDDTILDFRKAEHHALAKSLEVLGARHDEAVLFRYSEINRRYWERLENGEITRDQVLLGRFVELLKELGSAADPARLRDTYENNLSHRDRSQLLFVFYSLYLTSSLFLFLAIARNTN